MGFLASLFRPKSSDSLTTILDYEIRYSAQDTVAVSITPASETVVSSEYIRLWLAYQAKTIQFVSGSQGMNHPHAKAIIEMTASVLRNGISSETNCFISAGVDPLVHFIPDVANADMVFPGQLVKNDKAVEDYRFVHPNNPLAFRWTEQNTRRVLTSQLALMQYAIKANCNDGEALKILAQTGGNLLDLYIRKGYQDRLDAMRYPNFVYLHAIGAL